MQRTTTINPRYQAVFSRNVAYMPLKPKYRPKRSRRSFSSGKYGSGLLTKARGNPQPPKALSMVPYAGQEQKFNNLFLDNVVFAEVGAPTLLGRPAVGTTNADRQGIKFKYDAIAVRGNIRMEGAVGSCVATMYYVWDSQPNLALGNAAQIFQPQVGGNPLHTYSFMRQDYAEARFTLLGKKSYTLSRQLEVAGSLESGGMKNFVYVDDYITVPKGKQFESHCLNSSVSGGIDARLSGALYLVCVSDGGLATGDLNTRVFFHDI